MEKQQRTTNHLINETSPYLKQHLYNPVDWYPWGEDALQKAKHEDKPIFLSIGYSACHWCHVMENESFEDINVAQYLNQFFISIMVDREERPDLDAIYMNAVVRMTGQGGWPMTVFLTPELQPFFGGTYFPPTPRQGMISFPDLLRAIHQAWQQDRQHISETANKVTESLKTDTIISNISKQPLRRDLLETARDALISATDWQNGGWGRAPKFPQPLLLEFLCQQAWRGHEPSLRAINHTLEAMSRGGMYDLVGGGFHRYSIDAHWLSPHFEKMLYDNAQLALVYLHAYLLTRNSEFNRICTQTLDFIARDLTSSQGGFYSSLDADSEGEEGKYYLWVENELNTLLTDEQINILQTACPYQAGGNFERKIIFQRTQNMAQAAQQLNLTMDELIHRLDEIFALLLKARNARPHPEVDTKVISSWNGLALRAFAEAGRYLDRQDYLDIAQKNAAFLLSSLSTPTGLHRSWCEGLVGFQAYLEDYASLILGLLALYQADFDSRWFTSACSLRNEMIKHFGDPNGGFFDTAVDVTGILLRPKELQDSAVPSGNSMAVRAELLLDKFTGDSTRAADIEKFLAGFQDMLIQYPTSFGSWLQVLDFIKGPVYQLALVFTEDSRGENQLKDYLAHLYIPDSILAVSKLPIKPDAPELLLDRPTLNNKPTAYVCQDFFCKLPVTGLKELIAQLPKNWDRNLLT